MKKLICGLLLVLAGSWCTLAQSAALGVFSEKSYATDKLEVKFIDVQGGHIFPQAWLKKVVSQYTGRKLTAKDIAELQSRLTRYYVEQGYATSGVIVPEQEVTDGVLVLQVVHGRITQVAQNRTEQLSSSYVQEYFRPAMTVPVNVQALNESLALLQEHELVEQASAKLKPGSRLGESTLLVDVIERDGDFYGVNLDNYQSPSIGAAHLALTAGHRNLLGARDRLQASVGATQGLKDFSLSYRLPVSLSDVSLQGSAQGSEYSLVEEPFDVVDLQSRSARAQFGLYWPLKRELAQRGETFLNLEYTRTQQRWFDVYTENTNSKSAQWGVNWQWRSSADRAALQLKLEGGVAAGDAGGVATETQNFRLAQVQGVYWHSLTAAQALQWRVNTQLADEFVPSIKRFSLGGATSVRGYRQNRFVRDSGVTTNLEWHWYPGAGWTLYPFFDYALGMESDNGQMSLPNQQLYSAGVGVRWQKAGFDANLMWGQALQDVESVGSDPQDKGIYLSLGYRTP